MVANLLTWWVRRIAQYPRLVLLLSAAATILGLIYTVETLTINTDTSAMIDPRLPYRVASRQFTAAFPPDRDSIVIAVESDIPEAAEAAADWLAHGLEGKAGVEAVFRQNGGAFFDRNGLLLLPEASLAEFTDDLAAAQPLLAELARDPRASTLFDLLGDTIDNSTDLSRDLSSLRPVTEALAPAIERALAGESRPFSWQGLMQAGGADADPGRQYLSVQPDLDFGSMAPAGVAIGSIRATIAAMPEALSGAAKVYVTGPAALSAEELESASQGVGIAFVISVVTVGSLLFWSVRSVWLAVAALITLNVGLLWTAAFAAVFVGQLNLISMTFAVLFVGLGEDFSIHFALRIREALDAGHSKIAVLSEAVAGAGPALLLCTVGAAFGFCAFVPTAYIGLSELGIIAGGGMLIAFFATVTVMPALLALKMPRLKPLPIGSLGLPVEGFLRRHARTVVALLALAAIGALFTLPQLTFDENPLNLKDPGAPSVIAFHHLAQGGTGLSYPAEILEPNLAEADALATKLRALPDIHRVVTLSTFLPADQDAKLAMLADLQFLLLPALEADPVPPPSDGRMVAAATKLAAKLGSLPDTLDAATRDAYGALRASLGRLAGADKAAQDRFQADLFRYFPALLERIGTAIGAEPITLDNLPAGLEERWLAPDGAARIQVIPTADVVHDSKALERFADHIRTIAPDATGAAIGLVEGGRAVTKAMMQAGIIAMVGLVLLLAAVLRSLVDMLYVLLPVLLAGLLTIASTTLLGEPLNFANVIALPLLFGLGVASGTHFVMRAREEVPGTDLFRTSTPRASVFSTLTTIFSFASLAVSTHEGIRSMGIMLAVAILWTLGATLLLLPALFELRQRRRIGRTGRSG